MRHNLAFRKLGRVSEHRTALLRNQAMALIRHERIETTMPKAKELRPFVERLITIAKRGVASAEANGSVAARAPHGRSRSCRTGTSSASCSRRSRPRYAERPGGYTRILRGWLPPRRFRRKWRRSSWSAASTTRNRPKRRPPRRPRLRRPRASAIACRSAARGLAHARRSRWRSKGQAGGQTRGKAQKSTTPRKAGGS